MRRRPDFIIIGAMKCATSTLHDQLALQPGILMSDPKEPNFFSDDDVYEQGLGWYDNLFAAADIGDHCGESSTHYTKRPILTQTVRRMEQHLPAHTKFVYVMRHPIDRLISHYIHQWTQRVITCSIDRAVDRHPELVAFSQYAMQLEPFLDAFGPDRICPVFFERLVSEPQEQLERVCRFLGYDPAPSWQEDQAVSNVSSARERRSPLRKLLSTVPGFRPLLHAMVPDAAWERFKDRTWRMTARPELSPDVRREIEMQLDDDLARLGKWLGTPLDCASFKQQVNRPAIDWHDWHIQAVAS